MWRATLSSMAILALSGCTYYNNQEPAPVVAINNYQTVTQGTHVVAKGETLYQIAWRYGRDYRDLAMVNHIAAPYIIHPGQRLSLKKPKYPPSIYAKEQVVAKPVIQAQAPKEKAKGLKQPTAVVIAKAPEVKPAPSPSTSTQVPFKEKWQWPVQGKIIKAYSATGVGLKGIDISGKVGTPVKSAESGKVVYSGQGLRGYGQLVIIKHNDTYLSAYGHNSQLLVKEGQTVSKGQEIAKMGSTDAQQVKLHFEIRKNGQPINPTSMLPKTA